MKHLFKAFSILTLTSLIFGASISFAEDESAVENEEAVTEATFAGSRQCNEKGCPKLMTNSPIYDRSQHHSNQLADQTLGKGKLDTGKGGESGAER